MSDTGGDQPNRDLDLATTRDIVAKELGELAVRTARLRGVEDVWQVQLLERSEPGRLSSRTRRSVLSKASKRLRKWLDRVLLDAQPLEADYRGGEGPELPAEARAWVEETREAWGDVVPEVLVARDRVAHVAWPTRDEEGLVGLRSGRVISVRTDEQALETRVLAVAGLVPGLIIGGLTWWGIGPVYGVVTGSAFAAILAGLSLGRIRGRALAG